HGPGATGFRVGWRWRAVPGRVRLAAPEDVCRVNDIVGFLVADGQPTTNPKCKRGNDCPRLRFGFVSRRSRHVWSPNSMRHEPQGAWNSPITVPGPLGFAFCSCLATRFPGRQTYGIIRYRSRSEP